MYRNRVIALLGAAILLAAHAQTAAAASFKIKVKTPGTEYTVNAIGKDGKVYAGKVKGKNVTISVPTKALDGASLYATKSGRLFGPVYGPSGSKALLFIVKKPVDTRKKAVTTVTLSLNNPAASQNYLISKKISESFFNKKYKYTASNTPSLGLNTVKSAVVRSRAVGPSDSDGDGVVDSLDVDLDGDGISNLADSSTGASSLAAHTLEDSPADIPFTTLYLGAAESLNWHINGSLSQASLDSVIGGANRFAAAFFFTFPPDQLGGITGAHMVCDSSLVYCRPTTGGLTGTAYYSGFSDGNQSLTGRAWSSITTDGSEYSFEQLFGGGALAASIQPRVGTSSFRAGDTYRVDFTNAGGSTLQSRSLTLPPYFVTAPAVRAFNTSSSSAGSDTLMNYSDTGSLGMNSSNPIVVSPTGPFAGKLRLNVWRLQRLAVLPDETGSEYRDYGHLNYGVIISNNSGEYSCGGLYSDFSGSLTELPSAGTGGSYKAQDGANLWPLVDGSGDYEPSNAAEVLDDNTVSFTVDLSACLARNGLTADTYLVTVIAAGVDTGHGANRAGQNISVSIP